MIYEINENCLIIKDKTFPHEIDIGSITKIFCGMHVKIYSEDKMVYQSVWNEEIQMMAEEIHTKYPEKELEYSNDVIDKWKQVPECEFRREAQKIVTLLENELTKYQERVPFEIHHEIVFGEELRTAVMTIWGEKNAEKVFLTPTSKQELLWGGQLLFASPKVLCEDPSKNIIAVDEKCIKRLRKMMGVAINNLGMYGWRETDSHAPSGSKWGLGIFIIQLTLLLMFFCLHNAMFKGVLGILMLVILGAVLFRTCRGRGYHWKWLSTNLLLGVVGLIVYFVWLIK